MIEERIIRILRFNPDVDTKPYYKDYRIKAEEGTTILDALHDIKNNQEPGLSFRRSCRSAICGSCGMNIQGRNSLACNTQVRKFRSTVIKVRPLPGFVVLKDLVVDIEPLFRKLERIYPYLLSSTPAPKEERLQSPENRGLLEEATHCILCGCCSSSCISFWTDKDYLGPATFVRAYRFINDNRDDEKGKRFEVISDERAGVWRCHVMYNCTDACPKTIDITWIISQLKMRLAIGDIKGK